MPGKEIGQFSLKATTHTVTPGPGKSVILNVNFEGEQTGEVTAQALGTLTVAIDPESDVGTYTYCGWIAAASGENVTIRAQGTIQSIGTHKWRFVGTSLLSDGTTNVAKFTGDLATRTIAGKLYESA